MKRTLARPDVGFPARVAESPGHRDRFLGELEHAAGFAADE
jgi:hypothetical protein